MSIKSLIKNASKYALPTFGLAVSAFAVDGDVASQVTALSGGVATVATVAGSIAAVSASVAIFKAVKRYFSKAS
ncbi:MAG: hypothetical protein WC378_11425 [Opitutaceae bacterium]|jgi:hypothetical protein